MRTEGSTLAGEYRSSEGQLQGRSQIVALANAHRYRIAGIPFLLVPFHFPFLRRQQSSDLAFDIDSGFLPQSELTGEIENVVDAEVIGKSVIISVARHHKRFVQIHIAVATRLPVTEAVCATGQAEISGVTDALLGLRVF